MHEPEVEQPSPVVPHDWQVAPPTAHAVPVGGSVHTLPVQHPIAHDVEVHRHAPPEHTWPCAQAAPAPHRHPPEGEQLSASPAVHCVHMLPSVPQSLVEVGVTQVLPLQHPVAHEAELHTQWPLRHSWPDAQACPPPQLHCPAVHPSAVTELHAMHAAPPVPQLPSDGVSQVAPAQQPEAQLAAVHDVHTPPWQFCSMGHDEHVEPPVPHAALVSPARQLVPEQQPPGHDVPLQTQAPWTQACPASQAGPEPHAHVPLLAQLSAVAPQVLQEPPAVPQLVSVCASHTPLRQQPSGQDVALQTHVPPTHAWPCAHSLLPPQVQAPAVHASERVASHAKHAAPAVPQVASTALVHVVPLSQHPVGHEAALHTQVPPTHCCPVLQGDPEPHQHSPMLLQLSARKVLHAVHAAPSMPHALIERALHVGPEQQPVAHVAAHPVHAPPAQPSPFGQLSHALPPLPHAPSVLPAWHSLLAQHPVGQETPSHTQAPLRQRWPVPQAAPPPHLHSPAVEHESAVPAGQAAQLMPGVPHAISDSEVHTSWAEQQPSGQDVASQTHVPCEQCRPAPQGAAVPHLQVPFASHVSAESEVHAKQVEPAGPQLESVRVSHVVPLQQAAHDVASQTQVPASQCWPVTQAALPPHVHLPCAEHPSAFVLSHATQALPPAPHVVRLAAWQSLPVQHPSGHAQLLQAPALHASPDLHAWHATPALPQALVMVPGSHVPLLQQPVAHEVGSQTHCPETQC